MRAAVSFPTSMRRCAAILAGALGVFLVAVPARVRVAFVPIAPQDLLMVLALVLMMPEAFRDLRERRVPRAFDGPLLFIGALGLALSQGTFSAGGLLDLAQTGFYCLAGVWLFSTLHEEPSWRRLQRGALLTVVIVLIALQCLVLAVPGSALGDEEARNAWFPMLVMAACLWLSGASWFGSRRTIVAAGLIAVAAIGVTATRAESRSEEPVAERWREAYAALSVLSDRPLWGVGPGNYQANIGAYYQGMPKENTIRPGTRSGYGILAATAGLAGLAAYGYWLTRLWAAAPGRLRVSVVAVAAAGVVTSMLTSQLLLLTALLHAIVVGDRADAA